MREQVEKEQLRLGAAGQTRDNGLGGMERAEQGIRRDMKRANEKRVRESSGVSSSSGCTSEESRAEESMFTETENDKCDSKKDQREGQSRPGKSTSDEGKSNQTTANAVEDGKPKLPRPTGTMACPRCKSLETKFCYYNNYNIKQPRYFCKACQRYWTSGGTLRNVPVGAGRRKHKNSKMDKFGKNDRPGVLDDTSKYGGFLNKSNAAMTYAAVAALKPQPMVISYQEQNNPIMISASQRDRSTHLSNATAQAIQEMNAADKRKSNRSRSRKKKHIDQEDSMSPNMPEDHQPQNKDNRVAGQMQDPAKSLQALLQWNAAVQGYMSAAGAQQAMTNMAPQAYQQILSNQMAQIWQLYQQQGWNVNLASAQGVKREGTQPGWQSPGQNTENTRSGTDNANSHRNGEQPHAAATPTVHERETTSQVPWWYSQMVNNFAAAQNPSGLMRSFRLKAQAQNTQENNANGQ